MRIFAIALALFASIPASAQDPAAERKSTGQDPRLDKALGGTQVAYERLLIWPEGEDFVVLFGGNVTATSNGMEIRADRLMLWVREKPAEGEPPVRQIYAEGNVSYRKYDPDLKTWNSASIQRIYYDLAARKAWLLELATVSHVSSRKSASNLKTDVVVRAREARLVSEGRLEAADVKLSTCSFGDPHYEVTFRRAYYELPPEGARDWRSPPIDWDPKKFKGDVQGVTVRVWGIPVFFWPAIAISGAATRVFPIHKVSGGQSDRFGIHANTLWGYEISKKMVDSLWPWDPGIAADDEEKWGEINWEIDWRQERGWAFGLLPQWKWGGYNGYVNSYYLKDKGPNPDNSFDQKFLPLEDEDRLRVRFFHRTYLTSDLRLDLEVSYLSDRHLLEEFFEQEFKEGKEQETVGYLRWISGSIGGYAMDRHRLNDFQTQVEFLPQLRFFAFHQPVIGGFEYTQEAEAAQLRQRFDEAVPGSEPNTWRLDTLNALVGAYPLGFLSLSPFAEGRLTWYQNDLVEEAESRVLATAGVRILSEWSRIFDASWEAVGLRRMRHIMLFEARLAATAHASLDPTELFPYDATDTHDRFSEVVLKTRHRFQTKVDDGKGGLTTHEFLEGGIQAEYYPNPDRDTGRLNPENFAPPFHWITLSPDASSGLIDERRWSNLHWDLSFRPATILSGSARGEYNPHRRQEEAREFTVQVVADPKTTFVLGQVFLIGVTNAFTVGAHWQVTEKWRFNAETQYDFKAGEFISRKLTVERDLHDFLFEVIFEEDVGRDEKKFYVTIVPKFLRIRR